MTENIDQIFRDASKATGRSERHLRDMATAVFASMLLHGMQQPSYPIWTLAMIDEGALTVEVNVPERRRRK